MHRIFRFFTRNAFMRGVKPIMFRSKPDAAHDTMLKFGNAAGKVPFLLALLRFACKVESDALKVNAMGIEYKNPIGLGAGLDKNAVLAACLHSCGFGHATFGSITGRKSVGNPRPWFHRLLKYYALVVHVGLANEGVDINGDKIASEAEKFGEDMKVAASIARTNDKEASSSIDDAIADYVYSMRKIAGRTQFIELNISCPNTYNGEPFANPENLDLLLAELDKIDRKNVPMTVKMPSDKTWEEFRELLNVIARHDIQAVTIANLRKDRTGIEISDEIEGNFSGALTYAKSNDFIRRTYNEFGDRFVIIGLGGVMTAEHAYAKIRAGATLVELVSGLMFKGPQVVADIKFGLIKLLERDGFANIEEAVGADA
ncbi:MAG: dihydroorotate dehydrogenase (quinone) [Bifidobacteriaceae bacterium]|nr:dihydroorotate dehydrogenase (quinone) [Bifidobacteriaceae bacterium]